MRLLKRASALLFLVVLAVSTDQYLFCPRYAFPPTSPFRGDSIYNPYRDYQAGEWTLANFHAHARSWAGITNGRGGPEDIHAVYDSLGYGIHSISNYMEVSPYGSDRPGYVRAYEHGYNIPKGHQLVLGDGSVVWRDYILPRTLSNKQRILDLLAANPDNAVIVNHPAMRTGHDPGDMRHLTNYDALEVLNSPRPTFDYWDTALSHGRMVSIVGNDDTHHAEDPSTVGRHATYVHAPGRTEREVIRAIKEGRTMGVLFPERLRADFALKRRVIRKASPALGEMVVDGDVLRVRFLEPVYKFSIIGQGGVRIMEADSTLSVDFAISRAHTYLRLSYATADGIQWFLNPVFRFQGRLGNRRAP